MKTVRISDDMHYMICEALKEKISSLKLQLKEMDEWEPVTESGKREDDFERRRLKGEIERHEFLYNYL